MTKKMTNPRHQDWIIYKDEVGNDVNWSMQHKDYSGYMIEVWQSKNENEWVGQILTEQKLQWVTGLIDDKEWLPAQVNPFDGPLEIVKSEVIRRGQYWASQD